MTRIEFQQKVASHHEKMYRVALSFTNDPDAACDLVQDTLVKLWVKRHLLDDIENLGGYCVGALRHQFADSLRSSRATKISLDDGVDVPDESAHNKMDGQSNLELVRRIIDTLPANQALVVKLSGFSGCSNEEIAGITGLSPANVRTLLSRGRKRIKELYINNK